MESLIRKLDGCVNNRSNFSTIKIVENTPCGYSMSAIWIFDYIENKHTFSHGKDCIKRFCSSLREHAINITDFEKKNMLPLTKIELKSHQNEKVCYICGKSSRKAILKKLSKSIKNHCHYTGKYRDAAHSISNSKLNVPNEILVVFNNG